MHLKTLTLRGFKSFASATTLHFEPGVTCVVGPNGSGKSNVVDALAWVMGEQGAKSLRGGKMEDVIFAGTAGRAPLGRAEVSLTIDNSDGALPIEYTEVTISRTLFRSGGSEYAINGQGCRLLDIQDLLSDSGLGREMHVIVGQGQLDAVLRATPEERRGFIEEAAGVLKHRKRKDKALRKLEAMQANLLRLGDLTAEIRRQLGPLGRQAQVARKAQVVQTDVRDARARLLADDLAQLTATLEQEIVDESAVRARRAKVEATLTDARGRLATLEREAAEAAPALSEVSEIWYRLSSLRERLRGTATLAGERVRLLGSAAPERSGGSNPADLAAQAERVRVAEAELAAEVEIARAALEGAVVLRQESEQAAAAAEKQLATALRSAADRREGVARLAGQVGARRSRLEATEAEIGRLRDSLAPGGGRATRPGGGDRVRRARDAGRGGRGGRGRSRRGARTGSRRGRAGVCAAHRDQGSDGYGRAGPRGARVADRDPRAEPDAQGRCRCAARRRRAARHDRLTRRSAQRRATRRGRDRRGARAARRRRRGRLGRRRR
ncbi:AAA family ATPase [Cellulomonas sp.]|uniref:chromosome segregation SMC family protein n=1 Tax=Cellulomonas sp. TaxID=40001 RepID=UPI0025BAE3AE|nr:AAA family ATPase [Cellulomonas sp.]